MCKPIAVLISDVHFSLNNIKLADAALRLAIDKAYELKVDLIVAGDLHDTKANLRGECVKAMIACFEYAYDRAVRSSVLVGNHDLINEKGKDNSLEFLKNYADLIKEPVDSALYPKGDSFDVSFIPYQNDAVEFERILSEVPKDYIVICHQGVTGAESGEYIFDKSAVNKEIFDGYRVVSGHYHRAQDVKCGSGLFSYIGSPYTMSFAEANDGPKGFRILYSDGSLELVPTNLRKHMILEYSVDPKYASPLIGTTGGVLNPGDLLWVKATGQALKLDLLSKDDIVKALWLDNKSFKLDKIPTDRAERKTAKVSKAKNNNEIMDVLIEESQESAQDKEALKALYRQVLS